MIGRFSGPGDLRIRMSKAGNDVFAALTPEQLAFDSSWADAGILYRSGVVAVPTGGAIVPFGETLPIVPFVVFWRYQSSTLIRMGSASTNSTSYIPYFCQISTSALTFQTTGSDSYTAGYMIFRGPN